MQTNMVGWLLSKVKRKSMRDKTLLSANGLGHSHIHTFQKMKLDAFFTLYIMINSKWTIEWHVEYKTVKLLEESIGKKSCNIV